MNTLEETTQESRPRHYHGNIVRWLFALNSVVLLISFPVFKTNAIIPIFFGTLLVITLILLSALTTSQLKWIHAVNLVVSLIGVATFEILAFATDTSSDVLVFIIRQGIALSFLLALYFSARSALGIFSPHNQAVPITKHPISETKQANEKLLAKIKEKNNHQIDL